MNNTAIQVHNLSKRYRLGDTATTGMTFREMIHDKARGVYSRLRGQRHIQAIIPEFWALRDVSFEVKTGEIVGIIGRNGAGKSTLLKILSRITDPTSGHARIRGRVGSLLEVGTGFHPELTGRENIYLNGAVLGMTKRHIDQKFDQIVDFAEVEQFLDTPVKRYSSGMYIRLAFAVAAHLEPEVLIVDEVLAVGDVAFQKKCLGRIGDVARQGRTVLFVSHNMAAIQALCQNACLLESGTLVSHGPARQVVDRYLRNTRDLTQQNLDTRIDRQGNGALRVTDILIRSRRQPDSSSILCGDDLTLTMTYQSPRSSLEKVNVSVGIYNATDQCLLVMNNEMVGQDFLALPREGAITCDLPRLPLTPGSYHLNVYCLVNGILADWVQYAAGFTVESGDYFGTGRLPPASHGGVLTAHSWSVAA